MIRKIIFVFILCIYFGLIHGQQVDLEKIGDITKSKPLTINGGLSAGSIFYNGNQASGRQDWTYYLNGTVNFNLYEQINVPITVNLTNLGADWSYPALPNRLSLHPSYKWVTAHIGDISMTFSPYTLSGHQFTGAGVDLTPGKFKVSAMAGRLLKEVNYNIENPYIMPNYKRMGAGIQVQYDAKEFSVGMIYFTAKDTKHENMYQVMDSLGITPMQNTALSWNVTLNIVNNLTFRTEYAISFVTRDTRSPRKSSWFLDDITSRRESSSVYHAINANLNYQLKKNTIGIGYERIDPEYKTLGAYYFNNDYENITLNFARPFLKDDKANIAVSFGVERDNLDNTKEEESNRYVGSVALTYNPTEDLQTNVNFSTFQSHRNLKSQFDYINETSPYDNMDTLRFTQLSMNLDGSIMYTFKRTEMQNQRLNLMASYQESTDRQGGIALPGNVSRFFNTSLGYALQLVPQNLNLTSSINYTYSYAGTIESYTVGPMVGLNMAFFKKTLTSGFSSSYNMNIDSGTIRAKVFNLRLNSAYRLKKRHNFQASLVWQNRDILNKGKTDGITSTLAYSFNF